MAWRAYRNRTICGDNSVLIIRRYLPRDKYETSWQRLDYTNAKYDCLEQSYRHLHVDVDLRRFYIFNPS
uniref:Uncharacterized protein n=1 Tax=Oryza rufipogon TaxID=4529 RepID=A0A0E0N490_ORYRU